jgi:GT2 family glycosyltransferase
MNDRPARTAALKAQQLRSDFFRLDRESFAGYVADKTDLDRRFVVELWLDGYPFKIARADAYSSELYIENIGDGCYGFVFTIPEQAIDQAAVVEVRLANTRIPIGQPIELAQADIGAKTNSADELRWLGGLRFEGWCVCAGDEAPVIAAVIDGETVAETRAIHWAHVGKFSDARLARRFDLHLPERFADGRVRRVHFVRDNGEDFPGSPLSIVAFHDGLKAVIEQFAELESERPRGEQFDRLLPMAMPFSEYAEWKRRFPIATKSAADAEAVAIALIGPRDPELSLASLQASDFPDWVAAALPEAPRSAAYDPGELLQFLQGDADGCNYVIFARAGARFAPDAIGRIASAFAQFPDTAAVYGDFDIASADDAEWPVAFPAFDYERLLEQGYCAHLFALPIQTALDAARAGIGDLYRLFMFALDGGAPHQSKIIHVSGALAAFPTFDLASEQLLLAEATQDHLRRRGVAAHIAKTSHALFPAVHLVRPAPEGSTTIVIPVRNRLDLLQSCLRSIQPALSKSKADVLIVDNDSTDPQMIKFLDGVQSNGVSVLTVPGVFNFAHLNNIAAERARGEFLCLLNNDVKALDDQWLAEMLGRISEADVGAVGALLLWPSGVVQHGGTVLGPNFAAAHAFCERMHTDPGYTDLLCVAHECSAVTAACLLTRRQDYLDVGGMDELLFPVNFNDVDYCLKLRAAGKRIVLTPHARLYHFESASRGHDKIPDRAARFNRELQNLRARWGDQLIADPYYNPTLSLDATPFSALAWPPRARGPRSADAPPPTAIPPGF